MKFLISVCLLFSLGSIEAYNVGKPEPQGRRAMLQTVAGVAAGGLLSSALPAPAFASGGATAGKYT
jgi:hypothetical protein